MFRLPVSVVFSFITEEQKIALKIDAWFSLNKQIQWVCKAAVMSFRTDR